METSRRRKPFVDSLLKDVGKGFMAGTICSMYYAHGWVDDGIHAVCKNALRVSGSAAVCFGVYTAIDYAMVSARRKEEPVLDCAVAAAGACFVTTLPRGVRYASGMSLIAGAIGGVALGGLRLLEGRTQQAAARHGRGDP